MLDCKYMVKLPKNQSGQALLMVLLSMAVALTLVLSVLSRTISDVNISSQDESSLRAFSAAEAGVEQALVVGSSTGTVAIGDASFSANVSGFAEGKYTLVFPNNFVSGEPAVVWFVSHDANGNLTCSGQPCFRGKKAKVCWGDSLANPVPALEATIFYLTPPGDYSTVRIARAVYDPNSERRAANNFSDPASAGNCVIDGINFAYDAIVDFSSLGVAQWNTPNVLQFMVLKLLYNNISHRIGVDVNTSLHPQNTTLPAQGQLIESGGTSGNTSRRIEVFQGYGELPMAFYSAIYSKGGLTK